MAGASWSSVIATSIESSWPLSRANELATLGVAGRNIGLPASRFHRSVESALPKMEPCTGVFACSVSLYTDIRTFFLHSVSSRCCYLKTGGGGSRPASPKPWVRVFFHQGASKLQIPFDIMPSKKKAAVQTTAVVLFDATKPITIYEGVDPDTKLSFYIGRTADLLRRAGEHDRSKYKIRELLKLKNFRFRDVVRPVPELPHGCHVKDAAELESYFIFQRGSIYDPIKNPFGCNARLGDHATDMSPERYAELTQMFATTGYVWPEEECAPPEAVSDELASARGVECVISELMEDARTDGDKEAVEALEAHYTLAKMERFAIEKTYYGVRAFAELVLANYKSTYVDSVDLNTLSAELNTVKDKLKEDSEFEDLAGVITAIALVASPDKGRTVSSTAAAGFLEGVVAMIGTREEQRLVWTNETLRKNIYEVRAWTRCNGVRKPQEKAPDAKEASLGGVLVNWKKKSKHYGGECTDLKSVEVVMRDFAWFPNFVGFGAKNKEDWKKLNAQLLAGFAWRNEPEFEGRRPIKGDAGNKSVYVKLQNLVTEGTGSPADVEIALVGLPAPRAEWYRKQISEKRKESLAKMKVRKEANKKKRKRGDEAMEEEEEGEEEEEEEEEGGEEDDV